MHSSLLVSWRRARVMIDCGADWEGRLDKLHVHAIVLTHAHPDHAAGLKNGAPCPVFTTQETWTRIDVPGAQAITVEPRRPFEIHGICFEAVAVEHSLRAPAVGYRITAGRACVFYVPDVLKIPDPSAALSEIQLYIGDGASILRPIVRRSNGRLVGHTSIRTQLDWCREQGVRRAIFTHCGSQIVEGNATQVEARVAALGVKAGVDARLAFDGLELAVG